MFVKDKDYPHDWKEVDEILIEAFRKKFVLQGEDIVALLSIISMQAGEGNTFCINLLKEITKE